MGRITIALDDIDKGPTASFSEENARDADKIRRKFKQDKAPIFIYEDGDKEKRKEVGKDQLYAGSFYVWKTEQELWENKEIIQNALVCSTAVYKENPYHYIKGIHEALMITIHTIKEVIAVGSYEKQRCMIAISENENKDTMLMVSFSGFTCIEDWKENLTFTLTPDSRYLGRLHEGFLKFGNSIDIGDIQHIAKLYDVSKIVLCGHSIGGSVSSIVHMNLLRSEEGWLEERDLINITFGAPFFGNEDLEKYARKNEFSRNMVHFASVYDVVPGILSVGHTFQTFQRTVQNQLYDATVGLSEVGRQVARLWINSNNRIIKGLQGLCMKAGELFFSQERTESSTVKEIMNIYHQLKSSLIASNLQNEYTASQFVPIGKYIILNSDGGGEMMNQSCKIVERILQSAVEEGAKHFSGKNILRGHSLENYYDLIKQMFQGFQVFHQQRIRLHKVKSEGCFKSMEFQLMCQFICANGDCSEFSTSHLYEEKDKKSLVFCRTCQSNTDMEEFFFHKPCSEKFHKIHSGHIFMEITGHLYEKEPHQIRKIF